MTLNISPLITVFASAVLCCGVLSSCVRAAPTLVEAEANPTAGDMKLLDLPDASAGKAVSMPRDWQPLLRAELPQNGSEFTIWTRHSRGAILLKSRAGGQSKDLKWIYEKPAELKWIRAGRWTREQLGEQLEIIRGGGGGEGPILDAVIFATDASYAPGGGQAATPAPTVGSATTSTQEAGAGINEGAALALGMVNAPKGVLVEAEANKPGGTNEIVTAEGASGGQAITSGMGWQLLFEAPVPAGEAFKIWVRHKNGPIALKSIVEGKSKDNWKWNRPADWTWTDMGTYSRVELGEKLRIGRGGSSDQAAPLVDAVVFAPDKLRPLPADRPDPNVAPQSISAGIDWGKPAGHISPLIWGINEHVITTPDAAADKTFQELLGSVNAPLIRIHHAALTDSWTDAKTRSWDVDKIKRGFEVSTSYGKARIMVCLNWAPRWLSENKVLTAAQEDEFALLSGRLVRVMRDEVKRKVDYWEITNELEGVYERAGKLDDLWRLYNKVALAIKREDPDAKTGGPALTYAKAEWVQGFLKNCVQNADFISWHNYGTGDHFESNQSLFNKVQGNISYHARGVLEALEKHAPNRKLETFLTEVNVKYTWDPYERRHQNVIGAIFMASVLRRMALDGVDGVTLWQQRGAAYGSLIDGDNKIYPALHLYRWGPKYLAGELAATTSGDDKKLELLAVTRKDGTRSVLLINKADHAVNLPETAALLGTKSDIQLSRLDADGYTPLAPTQGSLSLPGYSLTLLTTTD